MALMTMCNNSNDSSYSSDATSNLYPALIECFGVILLGYITGRLGIISSTECKGLSKFAINATLPAFIFRAIVNLDFSRVTWQFVLVVALAKALLFAGVAILTLLFTRNIGKAGIYGVFCTVSNDLALGIPVLNALYKETHEDFVYCVYFLVFVSLTVILPLGIMMMEFNNQRSKHGGTTKLGRTFLRTLKAVIKNPVILSSIIGIPCNFIFHQKIPHALDEFFVSLGNAFPAAALFFLGLSVVGKIKAQVGIAIVVPLALVAGKVLVLPFLIRVLLISFPVGGKTNYEAWSIFGFIYGTIPTAPPVAIYASVYNTDGEMLTSGMVIATIFSAPVMFTSSKMASVHKMNSTHVAYRDLLTNTRNDISFVAIVMVCWAIVVLLLSRRSKVPPHNYTICLAITQLCLCLSFVITKSESFVKNFIKLECFIMTTFLFATHCWCAVLAFAVARIRCHLNYDTFREKLSMYLFGWGFPVCCSGILLIFLDSDLERFSREKADFFHYLQQQIIFSSFWVTIQFICVIICISSLLYLHRCDSYCKCTMVKQRGEINESSPLLPRGGSEECHRCKKSEKYCGTGGWSLLDDNLVHDTEDTDVLLSFEQDKKKDKHRKKDSKKDKLKLYYEGEQHQIVRHIVVIMALNLLMIVCIFHCMWILVGDNQESGINLEVQLLVTIILSGQAFVIFVMFGFDRMLIVNPFLRKLRYSWYGVNEVILPSLDDLPPDEYHICEQFVRHHKANYVEFLTSDKSHSNTSTSTNNVAWESFLGSELVVWLIEVGLVSDRITAVHYGNSLLRGHVIQHVKNRHYFTDSSLVYEFCQGWEGTAA